MTDTPSSPTDPADDDLLASLYLDGEATKDERAQVEADPALMARVEAFRAIAGDLANVAPPPDLGRIQISAALDLFDKQQAPAAAPVETLPPASTPGVTSLAERRERRQSRGIPSWLGVAAAGALVVGGLGFASTLGGGGDDASTTDAAMESSEEFPASAASRVQDEAETSTAADSGDSFESDDVAEESEAMTDQDAASDDAAAPETDSVDEDSADEDSADEDSADAAGEEASEEADEIAETGPGPIPLDGLEADTAAGYLALLGDPPLQPIANSPCAGSPLVDGLFGVDSFIPVVFNGVSSSLLVQQGVPSTAVIVGPTCEIALQ